MLVSADEYWAGSPAKIVKLRWGLFSAALLGFFVLIFAFLIGLLLSTFRSSLVPPLELKQIESEADKKRQNTDDQSHIPPISAARPVANPL